MCIITDFVINSLSDLIQTSNGVKMIIDKSKLARDMRVDRLQLIIHK